MTGGKTASEEEILDAIKIEILEEKRAYLCKYLDPKSYFPSLRSASLIDSDDEELILAEPTRKRRCEKLLDILMLRGPLCYEGLIRAIQYVRTQTFLVETLNKELEKRKNNLNTLLKGPVPSQEIDLAVDTSILPKPTPRRVGQTVPVEDSYETSLSSTSTILKFSNDSTV
ncbi:hypothetical protein FSP39_017281 [Pinctada imbricata]|uniref:CARD domain-containing protein n=1 Tax=Pinctada imbricata TaxID=66713 RepID=A0AA89BZD7_PINIB|nr:hypothetical protein FSP39_017281 [Pinctada imbricata]